MALGPHPKQHRHFPCLGAAVLCKRKDSVSASVLDELVLAMELDALLASELGVVWACVLVYASSGLQ